MNQVLNHQYPIANISAEAIHKARQISQQSGRRLIEVLEDQSELPQEIFLQALGTAFKYAILDNKVLHELSADFDVLPFTQAYQHGCIPLRRANGALVIVIADPFAEGMSNWLLEKVRDPFVIHLSHYADVAAYLSRFEETVKAMDKVMAHEEETRQLGDHHIDGIEQLSLTSISADASPVIRLVNSTLYDAMKIGASDIHMETTGVGLALKYRIDGVLDVVGAIQGAEMAEQVISRIKVMAELDIAERRIPQDGRFKVYIC